MNLLEPSIFTLEMLSASSLQDAKLEPYRKKYSKQYSKQTITQLIEYAAYMLTAANALKAMHD